MSNRFFLAVLSLLLSFAPSLGEDTVFPHKMPDKKPDIELSSAMERMFRYPAPRPQDNELFSQFKYTRLKGLENNGGDGTITRRDPSRPILVDGLYHVWYTKRDTIMARFDCDLSLDVHDPALKKPHVWHRPEVYFQQGLSAAQRQRISEANRKVFAE